MITNMVNKNEAAYLKALEYTLKHGEFRDDRTGVGTKAVFGMHMKFDLQHSFPVLVGKSVHMKSVIGELLWFLSGSTNIKYLKDNGIRIWDEWADEDGEVGKLYGYQWRNWEARGISIDQIEDVVHSLRNDPTSRRHVVSAWNPANAHQQNLPPCHIMFQFYITNDNQLDCQVYQRSADMFLGVPFDIASYAALIHIMCNLIGTEPGKLHMTFGDTHIYQNHMKQVKEYIERAHTIDCYQLPVMQLHAPIVNTRSDVSDLGYLDIGDFELKDYNPLPAIKAKVAK